MALFNLAHRLVRKLGDGTAHRAVYLKLAFLAAWALGGVVIGFVVVLAAKILAAKFLFSGLTGYGWVIMGSMAGAWLSLAATRREISFQTSSPACAEPTCDPRPRSRRERKPYQRPWIGLRGGRA